MLLWPFPHWCYKELGFMKLGPFTTPWFYSSPWEEGLIGWQPTDHILEVSGWGIGTRSDGRVPSPQGSPHTPPTPHKVTSEPRPPSSPSWPWGPGLKTP